MCFPKKTKPGKEEVEVLREMWLQVPHVRLRFINSPSSHQGQPVSSRVLKKEVTSEWTYSSATGVCTEKAAHRKFFCGKEMGQSRVKQHKAHSQGGRVASWGRHLGCRGAVMFWAYTVRQPSPVTPTLATGERTRKKEGDSRKIGHGHYTQIQVRTRGMEYLRWRGCSISAWGYAKRRQYEWNLSFILTAAKLTG